MYRFLFARRIFKQVNLFLFDLSLRGLGVLNYENDKVSGQDYLLKKILPSLVKTDSPVCLDIGANVGNFTSSLIRCFPNATIHAFEPQPKNYLHLTEKIGSSQIKAYNVAMGQTRCRLTLYDRSDSDGSEHATLHRSVISEIHQVGIVSFEVDVQTLDDFAEEEGVKYIDFLKIDTEGNELAVLQGATKMLTAGNIGCVFFEFNEMNVVSRVFIRDFRKILHNYEMYRLLPNGLLRLGDSRLESELFAYQNILALPKKASER